MASYTDPEEILKAITAILDVLKASPDTKIARRDQAGITAEKDRLKALLEDLIPAASTALTKLTNERDDLAKKLNTLRSEGLSAVRGVFGADSTEYESAGGTRASERKPAKRTKKPA
jgi:hypothetical protein